MALPGVVPLNIAHDWIVKPIYEPLQLLSQTAGATDVIMVDISSLRLWRVL